MNFYYPRCQGGYWLPQHNGSQFADLSLLETATAMSDDDACWLPRRHHQTPPSHERTIIATSTAYPPADSTSTASAVAVTMNPLLDCSADSCYQEGSGKQKAPLRHEVEEQQWRWGDSPPSSLQYHPHTANARTAPPHTPTGVDPMSYLLNTTMTSHADMCGWGMVGSVPRRGGLLVSSLWGGGSGFNSGVFCEERDAVDFEANVATSTHDQATEPNSCGWMMTHHCCCCPTRCTPRRASRSS